VPYADHRRASAQHLDLRLLWRFPAAAEPSMMKVFSPENPVPQGHYIVVPTYLIISNTQGGDMVSALDRILSYGARFGDLHFHHDARCSTNSGLATCQEWSEP
jgi:hypothetical protein